MAFLPRRFRRPEEQALYDDPLEEDFVRDPKGNVVLPDLQREEIRLPGPMRPPDDLGSMTPPYARQSRYEQINEARDVYKQGAPGRLKSALTAALRNFGQGAQQGGIAGGLGSAAAGGLLGLISPSGAREMEFEQTIRPQIQERFAYEDYDAAQRRQAEDRDLNRAYKTAQIGDLESQAEARRLPRPVSGPAPSWQKGRNLRTGRMTVYNAADPGQNAEHEPYTEERRFAPDWRETNMGLIDLNNPPPSVDVRKLRLLKRPRGSGGGAAATRRDEQDAQRQTSQAAAGIAAVEKLAREAMEKPEVERQPILNQMAAMVESLRAQFGDDLIETGTHNNWPFARLRKREAKTASQRSVSKNNDPLGIR